MKRLAIMRRAKRQTVKTTVKHSGTALTQYQRLESTGLWRASPEEQRREVIVRMGEATLVLSDPRSELALTHWSLPAVVRLNPGEMPPLFAPGEESAESVEIEDDAMLAALKQVSAALRSVKPHPGRLRGWLIGGALCAVGALAFLVLPNILLSHTAKVAPAAKRAEIGMRALDDVTRLTGLPCHGAYGLPELGKLAERVFGPEDTPILYILPEGLTRPAHLPGGVILLPKSLLEQDNPDVLAGAALAEGLEASLRDPLRDILDHAGVLSSLSLLTSGDLPDTALRGYGETLLAADHATVPLSHLASRFQEAQLPLAPYAKWRAAENLDEMLAADPYKGTITTPLLQDDDWIALQSVCSDA